MNWKLFWHKRQKEILEKISKNPSNSILFSWPKWIWKLEMAKDFAKIILWLSGENCEKIDKNIFPDCVILDKLWIDWCDEKEVFSSTNISQEDRKKKKVKTDIISISDIQKIIEIANKKPQFSTKKIIIIRDIERMNISSANAFLKTLEEPASDIFFICTTSNKNLLLETIISRVQEINFFPLKNEDIEAFLLKNNFEWNLKDAISFSFWKISKVKKFLENDLFLENDKKNMKEISDFFNKSSYLEKIKRAEIISSNIDILNEEIWYWFLFSDLEIKNWNKKISDLFSNLINLQSDIKSNVNKKIALENFYFGF